jgi:predicted dinucleotide-binding enzyme
MNISIIGPGNMGANLGKLWNNKGHKIFFAGITPAESRTASDALNGSEYGTVAEAFSASDVIILAMPYSALNDVLSKAGDMKDKILVDIINPLTPDIRGLVIGCNDSCAEEIARNAPGAIVVKTLNTIASPVLESGDMLFKGERSTMFYCGDDEKAKSIVAGLLNDLDFEPIDAGPLKSARILEPMALLILELAIFQNMGTNIAIKLLKR